MNEEQFDHLLLDCSQALKEKQARLESHYGLAAMSRWNFDRARMALDFHGADGHRQISFAVTPIGTFSVTQETWKWAWANGNLEQPLRDKAEAFKELAARTDYDLFKDAEAFQVDAGMAWELAALAVEHIDAVGCYRAPNRETWLFLALEQPLLD